MLQRNHLQGTEGRVQENRLLFCLRRALLCPFRKGYTRQRSPAFRTMSLSPVAAVSSELVDGALVVCFRWFSCSFVCFINGQWCAFPNVYFEREREREQASRQEQGRGRERGRDRIPGRLCAVSPEPDLWLQLTNPETMTWANIKSRTLNPLSHPGALCFVFVFVFFESGLQIYLFI